MIKTILILLLAFFIIFLLIKFFKSPNLKIKYLLILFSIGIVIYFIYSGKIGHLLSFLRTILPNLLKLLGI
tara:strand:+ start:87 stop:299 length:213 start_codon:yes stop_codon:yes gene_type:complete